MFSAKRCTLNFCLFAGVALFASTALLPAHAESLVPASHHCWGSYPKGSWKLVRVTTNTLDEMGRVTAISTSEIKTTLVDVTEEGILLRAEITLEVGGRRITTAPQMLKQGFGGEGEGQKGVVKSLGAGDVTVDGKSFTTEIRQMSLAVNGLKRTRTIHYCDAVVPYVLKEETVAGDASGKTTSYTTDVEVVALDMPYKVMGRVLTTSHRKVTNKTATGSTFTMEIWSDDVPGGVVAHSSKELDHSGRVLRHSTLELADYGITEDPMSPRIQRARLRRRGG